MEKNLNIPGLKHISVIRNKALDRIEKRRSGEIKAYRTPWPKINDELVGGIEWGTVLVVAGESGSGKTAFADQIINEGRVHNPEQPVAALKIQMEMTDEQTGVREFTGLTQLTVKQLYSVRPGLTDETVDKIKKHNEEKKDEYVWQISDPQTVPHMEKVITAFCQQVKLPTIIEIDHSILVKRNADEASQLETLYNLANMVVKLKKIFPMTAWIILTQMNRSIEELTRLTPGSSANYPKKADIFGGDALYQCCDYLVVLMRPFLKGIRIYGDIKIMTNEQLVVVHILKNRFDKWAMLSFREDLKNYRFEEGDPFQLQNTRFTTGQQ